MKVVRNIRLDAPLEKVVTVLCSEAYQLEREKARVEVVSTSYQRVEENDERMVFELRSIEYKRTMTGGIDRSGTVDSLTRNTWNARDRTLIWIYQGGAAPARMSVSGIYHCTARGDGTELIHEISIEVKVPLIGEKIAKLAAREFEQSAEVYEGLLRRRATEG